MDSERFGRALGFGARAAAKTLVTAIDAAAAPNPSKPAESRAPQTAAPRPAAVSPQPSAATRAANVSEQVARSVAQARATTENLNQQSRQLQKTVLSPVRRLSGVLWLEFTGFFFGLFSVSAASAAWKLREALHETPENHDMHVKLLLAIAISVIFGYFCVSSFVRARRRERAR